MINEPMYWAVHNPTLKEVEAWKDWTCPVCNANVGRLPMSRIMHIKYKHEAFPNDRRFY